MFKKETLSSGLRMVFVPVKEASSATILLLVGTGSKYERKEENGISHFLEHMFFQGTKKRPDQSKIAETLDSVGGIYNAFTGNEYTGFWAKVASDYSDLALDFVSDIFLNSKIEEKKIEKEKGVIIEEINMHLDIPQRHVLSLWEKLLYGNQPAGRTVLGEKTNVRGFVRKDFINYFKRHYSSKNTVICLAGNIRKSSLKKKVERYFRRTNKGKPQGKPKVIESQSVPKALLHYKKTDQTHLCLGVRACDLFSPKRYIQEIIANVLGGMMSSRLFLSIRGSGLAYYVATSAVSTTDTGYIVTAAGTDNKRTAKTITLILKEYKALRDKKISASELQKAKDYTKGTLALNLESSDAQASFYGLQELLEKKVLTPDQVFNIIDKITQEDLQGLAKEVFVPQRLNLALIGPFKDDKKFKKLLKI